MGRRKNGAALWLKVLGAVMAAAILLMLLAALKNLGRDSNGKGKEQMEQSVRRCVMACYADEGVYPPDVDYMRENYGLQVDDSRYLVFYTVFAGNMMPDITVLEK